MDIPLIEGWHLTIAGSTVQALREAGHKADLILTPQKGFGRVFRPPGRIIDAEEDGLGTAIEKLLICA